MFFSFESFDKKIKSFEVFDCKSIDIPKNSAGASYCFYTKYIGCNRCENYEQKSESDSSGIDDDDDNSNLCNHNSVKLTFFDMNNQKCSFLDPYFNQTYSTILKPNMCTFFGIPDDAVKLNVCFCDSHIND